MEPIGKSKPFVTPSRNVVLFNGIESHLPLGDNDSFTWVYNLYHSSYTQGSEEPSL